MKKKSTWMRGFRLSPKHSDQNTARDVPLYQSTEHERHSYCQRAGKTRRTHLATDKVRFFKQENGT